MSKPALPHVMIRASAGSGKTYQLTERFIQLLEAGAPPERIVALTFTRKAAGEFFDEILKKVASAAEKNPALLPRLRTLIDAMPRLRLGTLDAFFAQIVRSFPFELGLTGDFELLQDQAARLERRRVLRRMFARAQGGLAAAQQEFIEAFKRATMGVEEKRLGARLDSYIDSHHGIFLAASAGGLWGNPERIWPAGPQWLGAPSETQAAVNTLRRWAEGAPIGDKQRERWFAFCDAVTEWSPGAPPPRELIYVLEKALEVLAGLRDGSEVVAFDRKPQPLDGSVARALADLALSLVAAEFARRLGTTQGIHKLLANYESFYHEAVRRGGRLTFADVQRLLEGADLELAYRLDGAIDHWLLDEFQDTSFGQWTILRNLVDEVVQDASGSRSFFCVGDVKQAIYAWREGDHRLFGEILAYYNSGGEQRIEERDLDESHRSGPAVIAMVNAVFGNAAEMTRLFPGSASEEWNAAWRPHSTVFPQRRGQAALLIADDKAARWQTTLDLLLEINPAERGWTCAVLVQKNDVATELAELIRTETGFPAVADSDLHVCADNPVGAALLALVQLAEHPEDEFAWQHVQMCPLAAELAAIGWVTKEQVARGLTADLQQRGYAATLGAWLRRLAAKWDASDSFNRERARQFVAAAAIFDESGGRSAAEFIEFMERYTLREPDAAGVIRVMTIHKAKGLGFDVVIAPDLQGTRLAQRRDGLAVQRGKDRRVEWILDLPSQVFWETDPVIKAHVEAQEASGCYEKLALLYVALTRAKYALYAITEPVPAKSESNNYPRLLTATLGETETAARVGGRNFRALWQAGQGDWFDRPAPEERPVPLQELQVAAAGGQRSAIGVMRSTPSAQSDFPWGAGAFALQPSAAIEFGSAVHELLASVEWADAAERERLGAGWKQGAEMLPEGAADAASGCLRSAENAPVWDRPGLDAEVWRERAFELRDEQAWVSGKFDRVVLRRGPDGRFVSATVYDFKTVGRNAATSAERYENQLKWYQRAAARLAGIDEAAVRTQLVWIKAG